MLQHLIVFVHGLLCFSIVALVLLQRGKGADAGAGFGSGASGTVFGARGSATFFSKLTAVLATLFFMTSMSLAWFATRPRDRGAEEHRGHRGHRTCAGFRRRWRLGACAARDASRGQARADGAVTGVLIVFSADVAELVDALA